MFDSAFRVQWLGGEKMGIKPFEDTEACTELIQANRPPELLNPEPSYAQAPLAIIPPSTQRYSPVINEALSLARKRKAFATSAGNP